MNLTFLVLFLGAFLMFYGAFHILDALFTKLEEHEDDQ